MLKDSAFKKQSEEEYRIQNTEVGMRAKRDVYRLLYSVFCILYSSSSPVASRKKLFERVFLASLKIYPKGIA